MAHRERSGTEMADKALEQVANLLPCRSQIVHTTEAVVHGKAPPFRRAGEIQTERRNNKCLRRRDSARDDPRRRLMAGAQIRPAKALASQALGTGRFAPRATDGRGGAHRRAPADASRPRRRPRAAARSPPQVRRLAIDPGCSNESSDRSAAGVPPAPASASHRAATDPSASDAARYPPRLRPCDSAAASSAHHGQTVMTLVADIRPAAISSRMPRLTPGVRA